MRKEWESAVRDWVSKNRDSIGKTLLVTEFIHSGNGMAWLTDILRENGVDFEVASVCIGDINNLREPEDGDVRKQYLAERLKYGGLDISAIEPFYTETNFGASGTVKMGTMQFKQAQDSHRMHAVRNTFSSPEVKRNAREDMKYLAHELGKLVDVNV
ncbi:MAG: hypothetical protein HGA31_04910 [Candidatus Moranbacteria bacterium]|nr:hypothetical protein [Candidatus Moranbacteria bacterium]